MKKMMHRGSGKDGFALKKPKVQPFQVPTQSEEEILLKDFTGSRVVLVVHSRDTMGSPASDLPEDLLKCFREQDSGVYIRTFTTAGSPLSEKYGIKELPLLVRIGDGSAPCATLSQDQWTNDVVVMRFLLALD